MSEFQAVRREAYEELDRRAQIGLVGWSAFTVTFAAARALTHAIRAERGPFRNISLGGEHLHHYLWGIGLVAASGGLSLSLPPSEDLATTLAGVYGVGAALVIDEFALLLNLEDVYWSREGRISVNLGIGLIAGMGTYLAAAPFWRRLVESRAIVPGVPTKPATRGVA